MFEADAIPDAFKERDQWLLWDESADTPRAPLNRRGKKASWNDPDEWLSFEDAADVANSKGWGVGYVMAYGNDDAPAAPFACIDIDGGLTESGDLKEWVPDIERFTDAGTYIERSPSGTGLHIPIYGQYIPDWWSDHTEEHEGVDVLANKFCTFTGDTTEASGSTVANIDPTPWLYDAYQAIHGEGPKVQTSSDNEYDGDESLDKSDVEEALDNVDPNLSYQDWLKVGMAVYDWDSGTTGKQLFEQWSRSNPKWDESRGQGHIDDIFDNDSPRGDVTVGTLVYHAKEGGWEPPWEKKASDGGTVTESPNPDTGPQSPSVPDGDPPPSAGELKALLDYDEDDSLKDIPKHELANGIELMLASRDNIHIRLLDTVDSKEQPIYAMNEETKVWENKGERRLAQKAREILGVQYRNGVQSELENALRSNIQGHWLLDRDELGVDVGYLPVKNRVLDLDTKDSREAKPEDYLLGRLPTEYDPDAKIDGTRFEEFLLQCVNAQDQDKLQEYAGYTLLKNAQPYKKALFLVGPQNSGKGTFLKTLEMILGEDNVASETLYNLVNTRWGTHSIYGKMVNISNEVSPSGLGNVGQFKMLTGGEDKVPAEDKGVSKYRFTVTQKFLFATNEFPEVEDAGEPFYSRLLFVEFPNSIPDEEQDEGLRDDLREERSAILNWMLEGLDRLRENGTFTGERPIEEKKSLTKAFGSTIEQFAYNALDVTGDSEHVIHKKELYSAFTRYCDFMNADTPGQRKFTRNLKEESGITDGQSTRVSDDGNRKDVFKGAKLNEEFFKKIQAPLPSHSYESDSGGQTGMDNFGE